VLLLELNGLLPIQAGNDTVIPVGWKPVTDIIILSMFVVFILVPDQIWILFVVTVLAGLMNILYGGNLLGLLFCFFAFAVGLRQGFFRERARGKISVLLVLIFATLVTQLKISLEFFVISLVNIVIALSLIFGFLYMFHDRMKGYYQRKESLDLRPLNLTDRQKACIQGCIAKSRLKDIAERQIVSESVIKKEMLELYSILGVEDYHSLYFLLSEHEVIL
jgi:hypothetical protein